MIKNKLISILDYDSGNLISLSNAIESIGLNVKITNNKTDIMKSDCLVIAGASNLDYSIPFMTKNGIDKTILEYYNIKFSDIISRFI